jgi:hypothetical protein
MHSGSLESLESDKNKHLFKASLEVCTMIVAGVDETQDGERVQSRTELDSHANMPVVGKNAFVLAETGRTCEVSAFTPDYEPMKVKIVDAALLYECPYQGTVHILVIRNCLHVPTMVNNLIPPFIMREAGIVVNDRPKIHSDDPGVDDHSIFFPESEFRITLTLNGVFSGFPTFKPDIDTLRECENIYMLTPTRWDPHDQAYRHNEDSMMDWQGEMIERKYRRQVLLSDVTLDVVLEASLCVSSAEASVIDGNLQRSHDESSEAVMPLYPAIPRECDEVASVLAGIDPCLNDDVLYQRLAARATIGDFMMTVGATTASSLDNDLFVETIPDGYDSDTEMDDKPAAVDDES